MYFDTEYRMDWVIGGDSILALNPFHNVFLHSLATGMEGWHIVDSSSYDGLTEFVIEDVHVRVVRCRDEVK